MLKEADIRPDELMEGQKKAIAQDHAWLMKHKHQFVEVACPACQSKEVCNVIQKYDCIFRVCAKCETMYMSPRPTSELIGRFLARSKNYEYWAKSVFPASQEARYLNIFKPRAEMVNNAVPHTERRHVLDIGAGYGTFLEALRGDQESLYGHSGELIALEPSPELAKVCTEKGFAVIPEPIEQAVLPSVDVITAFELIEHLFSPTDLLAKCHNALTRWGKLILTCPNGKGFDIITLKGQSSAIGYEHLNYFNPESMRLLLSLCGFDIVELTTPGQLDAELVRKQVLSGDFDISRYPFLKQVLIDRWDDVGENFQRFLAENMLSSHMWVVARKR